MKIAKARAIQSLNSARGVYTLTTLTHSGFSQVWRLVNNAESIFYQGDTYESLNFEIAMGNTRDAAGASIVIGNIDRRIAKELQSALASNPNEDLKVEFMQVSVGIDEVYDKVIQPMSAVYRYKATGITITKQVVTAGLVLDNSFAYNIGKYSFNSTDFPNINI